MRLRYTAPVLAFVFVGAAAASAVAVEWMRDGTRVAPRFVGSTPPSGIRAAPFTLRSYRGTTVSMSSERGKVVVLTFLDSKCADQCPAIAHVIGRTIPRLTPLERRDTVALAVSVEPGVDTPANVRTFLRETRASGSLDFLTRPVAGLVATWKAYHVLSAIESGNSNIHSADVMIFNPHGLWVSSLNQGVDLTSSSLLHDIRAALRDDRD